MDKRLFFVWSIRMMNFLKYSGIAIGIILLFVAIYCASTIGFSNAPKLIVETSQVEVAFYANAYNNLISTHVGLFTALIAVAIAIFGVQKWLDRKELDDVVNSRLPEKIDDKIEEEKPKIINNVKDPIKKELNAEVERITKDYLCIVVDVNLSFLKDEQKKFFCKEFAKRIYLKYFISNCVTSMDPFLGFKSVLAKLFEPLEKDDLKDEQYLIDFISEIRGKIINIKNNNFFAYKRNYENFLKKINSLI